MPFFMQSTAIIKVKDGDDEQFGIEFLVHKIHIKKSIIHEFCSPLMTGQYFVNVVLTWMMKAIHLMEH